MALLANINRDPKKRASAYTSADFMPTWQRPEPQSPAQMFAVAAAITVAMGGTIERSPGGEPRRSAHQLAG